MVVNMKLLDKLDDSFYETAPAKAKRETKRINLLDVTASGVVIGVFRESVYELHGQSAEMVKIKITERIAITVNRPYYPNRFAKIYHFPKDQLERALTQANQIAQLEIQRATAAVAV